MIEADPQASPESQLLQVVTACPDRDVAGRLARAAVEARLAACVQISGPVMSIYHWQGQIEEAGEVLCFFKTLPACYAQLEALILSLHPYDTPEIIAQPSVRVSSAYLEWLRAELNQPKNR